MAKNIIEDINLKYKLLIKNIKLKYQLIIISIISVIIPLILLIFIIPIFTNSFYEKNLYEILKQPINYINPTINAESTNIAYIIEDRNRALVSDNFYIILNGLNANDVLNKLVHEKGKFTLDGNTYYYYTVIFKNSKIITLTNNQYIKTQQNNLNRIILPMFITVIISITSILLLYSNYLLKKINKLKDKVDNLDNKDYNHSFNFEVKDELEILNNSIEKLRIDRLNKDTYKNNMFQSISHELKTPITIILSHIEGMQDRVVKYKDGIEVIKEQSLKLDSYVESLLKLNKIAFIKDNNKLIHHNTIVSNIINDSIYKYKNIKKDIDFSIIYDKEYEFSGDAESWGTVIENLLSNFIRYANKRIEITISDNKIKLYNDGEQIEDTLIDNIFKPYEKGNNGHNGLGLSIVYMTLDLFNYVIKVENVADGVLFTIEKDSN